MPAIDPKILDEKKAFVKKLDTEYNDTYASLIRDLADMFLPRRYKSIYGGKEAFATKARNPLILDSTPTNAARTLATGLMNGITSSARPWFRLRTSRGIEDYVKTVQIYLDEVQRIMLDVLAQSNFYTTMQQFYFDEVVFGTAVIEIYEDADKILRCYIAVPGTYRLAQSAREIPDTFSFTTDITVKQYIERFPDKRDWSDKVTQLATQGGSNLLNPVTITQLVEPNDNKIPGMNASFVQRKIIFEPSGLNSNNRILSISGFTEEACIAGRWDAIPSEPYGFSPCMDALGDAYQLQDETMQKGIAMQKMVTPPMVGSVELRNKPNSTIPGAWTYVNNLRDAGAKPAYQINPPLGEMTADLATVAQRMKETLHNPLFTMFSELDKVRSATEIDAKREERLVLLGGFLERNDNEVLDKLINRTFHICERRGLLPEPPPELEDEGLEVEYFSMLSAAQRAVQTAPVERFLQFTGNLGAVYPGALDIPNVPNLLRNYGRDIGVKAEGMNSAEEVAAAAQQREVETQSAQALEAANSLSFSAANLAKAEVGGGSNVLEELLG